MPGSARRPLSKARSPGREEAKCRPSCGSRTSSTRASRRVARGQKPLVRVDNRQGLRCNGSQRSGQTTSRGRRADPRNAVGERRASVPEVKVWLTLLPTHKKASSLPLDRCVDMNQLYHLASWGYDSRKNANSAETSGYHTHTHTHIHGEGREDEAHNT